MRTSEGFMDLDFDNMELYKQSGDLLCPMVPMPMSDSYWWASCPTGACYLIQQVNDLNKKQCAYVVRRLKAFKVFDHDAFSLKYEGVLIGTSEVYNLDV